MGKDGIFSKENNMGTAYQGKTEDLGNNAWGQNEEARTINTEEVLREVGFDVRSRFHMDEVDRMHLGME
jgi:hypothetical protein